MEKRGQITIFLAAALVVLFVIMLLFLARGRIIEQFKTPNVQQQLQTELTLIEKEISRCVTTETNKLLEILARQGGHLHTSNTVYYNGKQVTVLCQHIPNSNACLSTPLVKKTIQQELDKELTQKLGSCIDLTPFKRIDYELTEGPFILQSQINPEHVLITLHYPLALKKDDVTLTKESYTQEVDAPLGTLIQVTNDILNQEATTGTFDPLDYTLIHLNKYTLQLKKPYPHKVYLLETRERPAYQLKFAIAGADA